MDKPAGVLVAGEAGGRKKEPRARRRNGLPYPDRLPQAQGSGPSTRLRIKLATELQRIQRGNTIYPLDEPTPGLHPADVERLVGQLDRLVDAGNTVIVVEHDMRVVGGSDWIIDIGPGAGAKGGRVVACGTPVEVSQSSASRTAPFLASFLK